MRYLSTAGRARPVSLADAVQRGLAEDGGLFLPEDLVPLPPAWLDAERPAGDDPSPGAVADAMLAPYLGDIDPAARRALLDDALDFPMPLVALGDHLYVLELFPGPTLAFKDVGARTLARLLSGFGDPGDRPRTVLVATSGDTGSAVAHAFAGVAGIRVAVLFPRGHVTPLQEKQMATLGGNVLALAVQGVFDDCQRLAKEAFRSPELGARFRFTSANSINIGRLLPQMVYYLLAVRQLPPSARPPAAPAPRFAVPSGNLGNLTAGLMAARMGLPHSGFVAATNANEVLGRFLASGRYEPRPSVATLSNAMDVGHPSNLDRIRSLYRDDLAALRRDMVAPSIDDDTTRETIRRVEARTGYVLDPHTAVAVAGLESARDRHAGARIVLATAHPIKFRETVEPVIGRRLEVPERLARCLDRPSLARPIAPRLDALTDALNDWTDHDQETAHARP